MKAMKYEVMKRQLNAASETFRRLRSDFDKLALENTNLRGQFAIALLRHGPQRVTLAEFTAALGTRLVASPDGPPGEEKSSVVWACAVPEEAAQDATGAVLRVVPAHHVAPLAPSTSEAVLFKSDSLHNHILVDQDVAGVRRLLFETGGAVQGSSAGMAYIDGAVACMEAPRAVPQHVLVIGLGVGAFPARVRELYPEAEIAVVEIDPVVVNVAEKFFGFKETPSKLKVYVADGRAWLEASPDRFWDCIFLDAYDKRGIPEHMATAEFLRCVKEKLARGGQAIGNVWRTTGPNAEIGRAYAEVFPEVRVLEAGENQIFVGCVP